MRDMLVEGKSNITRVNFSAFLLFLILKRELNKMKKKEREPTGAGGKKFMAVMYGEHK
jgi:hypothetical protein